MQYQTFEHDDKMVGFKTWLVSYLKDNPIKKGDSVRVEIPA